MTDILGKPQNSGEYCWDDFCRYCEKNGINLANEIDWIPWWDCWVSAQKIRMLKT